MPGLLKGNLTAHDGIAVNNPFAHQRIGSVVEVARREEIVLSVITEATKRVKARIGVLPEGFLNGLKEQFPEWVPHDAVEGLARKLSGEKAAGF